MDPKRPAAHAPSRSSRSPQISTVAASFEDDLAAYAAAGLDGIGIWELEAPGGRRTTPRARGSRARAVSSSASAVPLDAVDPAAAAARRPDRPCRADRRALRVDPPARRLRPRRHRLPDRHRARPRPDDAREIVVDGLRTLAGEAELAGVRDRARALSARGRRRVDDRDHDPRGGRADRGRRAATRRSASSSTPGTSGTRRRCLDDIRREIDRFAGVHVCDVAQRDARLGRPGAARRRRRRPAGDARRARRGRAGTGSTTSRSSPTTARSAAHYPDSLWDVPAGELARRGRAALLAAWESRPRLVRVRSTTTTTGGCMRLAKRCVPRSRSSPPWRLVLGTAGATNAAKTAKPTGTPIVIGAAVDLTKNMAPFDAPALAAGADRDREDQRGRRRRRPSAAAQVPERPARPAADQAGRGEARRPEASNIGWVTCDVDYATPAIQEFLQAKLLTVAPCIGTDQMGPSRFGSAGELAFSFGNAAQDEGSAVAEYAYQPRLEVRPTSSPTSCSSTSRTSARASRTASSSSAARSSTQESFKQGDKTINNVVSRVNGEKPSVIAFCTSFARRPAGVRGRPAHARQQDADHQRLGERRRATGGRRTRR